MAIFRSDDWALDRPAYSLQPYRIPPEQKASVALIDEIEHGLEPHRISRLLSHLKTEKDEEEAKAQVFMTTHSPVVLQELSVAELNVVRRDRKTGQVTICPAKKPFKDLDVQSQPRVSSLGLV
jgi:putative ATP-dependent endonuclease of OLD family